MTPWLSITMIKFVISLFCLFYMSSLEHKKDFIEKIKYIDPTELHCLAKNAYHEAFGEGHIGMLLVTQVVFNRASKQNKNYCEVVYEPFQFSWTLQKRPKRIKEEDLIKIKYLIIRYINGLEKIPIVFSNATHFHTIRVNPKWNRKFTRLGVFKQHIFYKGIL